VYRLTRDDGAELQVTGNVWESALELASLYGWEPAGTESPEIRDRVSPDDRRRALAWDRMDYFSYESQRVGPCDARALAESVIRALADIPEREFCSDATVREAARRALSLPSRHSAVVEGMSAPRRKLLRRLAAFADRGGFLIEGSR
jgi:hypothetical protein